MLIRDALDSDLPAIGWYFFGETMGAQKIAAITLIAAGVALLATA